MIVTNAIARFAIERVGDGYIYGAKGQVCSPAFRQQQARQYPEWEDNILRVGAKWDGNNVWDCAQLTRYAAKAAGYSLPSGATSQWTKGEWAAKGTIADLPAGKIVFLYRGTDKKMQHTGIAIGDGTCVHAKGTADGVIRQRVDAYKWTHWAALPDKQEEEDTMPQGTFVTAENGLPVYMRAGPSTRDDYIAKIPVGTQVTVKNLNTVDGTEWALVTAQGKTGYMMAKYLTGAELPAVPDGITISKELARQLLDAIAPQIERG